MKKILFPILLMALSVSLFPEVQNRDKPLKGEWDFLTILPMG